MFADNDGNFREFLNILHKFYLQKKNGKGGNHGIGREGEATGTLG